MATILTATIGTASFIERDEHILGERHRVKIFRLGTKGIGFLGSLFPFILWILRNIWTADLLFARFAHYHAFLLGLVRRLFRKKFIIVVGGSDAVWIPRFGYGVYANSFSRRTTRWALSMADLLLPVHESLVRGVNSFSDNSPRSEGLLEYYPTLRTPVQVIHNGYDTSFWHKLPDIRKESVVLTVALATEFKVFVTKGLDHYIATAAEFPRCQFMLVGVSAENARRWWNKPLPDNLILVPPMTASSLRELYSKAKVFAHFTLTEGMPNVLCEAMLCECVPVGSAVNSIPDIIGEAGFLVPRPDRRLMKRAVEEALDSDLGPAARRRIVERYPLERRRKELLDTIDQVLQR